MMPERKLDYFERRIRVYPKKSLKPDDEEEEKEFSILGDDSMYINMDITQMKVLLLLGRVSYFTLYIIIALYTLVSIVMPLYKGIFLFKSDLGDIIIKIALNTFAMIVFISAYLHFFGGNIDMLIDELEKRLKGMK